jgi:glutathione S-transferase
MAVELHGYRFSVYAWVARLALHEKGVGYAWVEVDPFSNPLPEGYLDKHPFGRVPTLVHDGFAIYETSAITRYVDSAFEGEPLQPPHAKEQARQNQVISVVDSYAYWPLVRQVFSHGFFRPSTGRPYEAAEVESGLSAAPRVLGALERLASGGPCLINDRPTLADIHLAPMIAYFTAVPRGEEMVRTYPRLAHWWHNMAHRKTFRDTHPPLPNPRT